MSRRKRTITKSNEYFSVVALEPFLFDEQISKSSVTKTFLKYQIFFEDDLKYPSRVI